MQSGSSFYGRSLVTITQVEVTPDLLIARAYVSIFNVEDKEAVLTQLQSNVHEIRFQMGKKLRHHLRRMPEIEFFLDNSLDDAIKIEEILKKDKDRDKDSES